MYEKWVVGLFHGVQVLCFGRPFLKAFPTFNKEFEKPTQGSATRDLKQATSLGNSVIWKTYLIERPTTNLPVCVAIELSLF